MTNYVFFQFLVPDMGRITFDRLEGEEAAKLDELFGVKDCLIEVNPGRVLLPPEYQNIGERIVDLKVRPDDIWLVSYPRTGNSLKTTLRSVPPCSVYKKNVDFLSKKSLVFI